MTAAQAADRDFAREMLPLVSRTFAPTIEILPARLAEPVRTAYLLCRVADTIEDAAGIDPHLRREWLYRFARAVESGDAGSLEDGIVLFLPQDAPETRLAAGLPILLRLLEGEEPGWAAVVRRWVRELSLGMARFVRMEEGSEGWVSLASYADLEAYEYYVAGTVGCMLHELIVLHLGDRDPGDQDLRASRAVAFGLGLQGTNILQDLSVDRARGWSYIPEEVTLRHGFAGADIHLPSHRGAAMAAIREVASRTAENLDRGIEFILAIPRRAPRIRIFCLWPLLLAVRTLSRVVVDTEVLVRRSRISRGEVLSISRAAVTASLSNRRTRNLYDHERSLLAAALESGTALEESR